MKIGFIGTGQVGGTLAKRFGSKGHSVFLGYRDQYNSDLEQLAQSIGANAQLMSIQNTITSSDVIILATPWKAVETIAKEYLNAFKNKILIDCTNPLKPDLSGLQISGENSGGEQLQTLLPQTKVIKAFNTVGFNIMENPEIDGRKSVMYFCGNDQEARFKTQTLIEELGFQPMDAGDIKSSRLLEPFALIWISTAYKYGLGRDFAFSINKNK